VVEGEGEGEGGGEGGEPDGGEDDGDGGDPDGGEDDAGGGGGGDADDSLPDGSSPAPPVVRLPRSSITASELGVVVNDLDPQSLAVAEYYVRRRGIPARNVVHLSFEPDHALTRAAFAAARREVEQALAPDVQALALTWTLPYRVDCMSVTSAFALGFDERYCSTPCDSTAAVPTFDSPSLRPYTDLGIRPTMSLAGGSLEQVQALIDRGVAADDTYPTGTGYLVVTSDADRSIRTGDFRRTMRAWEHEDGLELLLIDNARGEGSDVITGRQDVLFYFTGLTDVAGIDENGYRPGAVADHVTSFGGILPGFFQMSVLRWLQAGATASYGTVSEPCNYADKFPRPSVLLPHYFAGETLIEAYWKSVATPGEGIFVGEPLARPWGSAVVAWQERTLTIRLTWLHPGRHYELRAADAAEGPYETVLRDITVPDHRWTTITLPDATRPFYELTEVVQP